MRENLKKCSHKNSFSLENFEQGEINKIIHLDSNSMRNIKILHIDF